MKDQIEKLLRIQGLDLRIRDLEMMLTSLPEELKAAEAELASRREDWKDKGAEIESLLLERRKLEGRLDSNTGEIGKFSTQLNEVKTNEQYNALQKEIDTLKEKNSSLEEEILIGMDRGEELEKEKKSLEAEVRGAEEKLSGEKERIEQELISVRRDIEAAREERRAAAEQVEKKYLSRYELIRGDKNRQAISRIEREACELCNRQVPPQRVIEVKKLKELIFCEGCGRILMCTD